MTRYRVTYRAAGYPSTERSVDVVAQNGGGARRAARKLLNQDADRRSRWEDASIVNLDELEFLESIPKTIDR